MAIQFDSANKYIKITSGTSITALEIYNAVMEWHDEKENMGYSVPMRAVGKANMGGGIHSDSIFILQNGWKIKLYDGNYQFTITGTLIALDENGDPYSRTEPPDSGNVEVIFQVSSQGTLVVSGSGVTQQDKEDIADLINPNIGEVSGQVTKVQGQTTNIEHHHVLRRKIDGDYIKYYDSQNELVMKYRMVKDKEERIIELIPEEV